MSSNEANQNLMTFYIINFHTGFVNQIFSFLEIMKDIPSVLYFMAI